MKVIIIICIVSNLFAYGIIYKIWVDDCKEIGKDNSVSLSERLRAAFLVFTLPCIVGLLMR